MLDTYLQIFISTCEGLIPLIPAVIVLWIIINLTAGLFFDRA